MSKKFSVLRLLSNLAMSAPPSPILSPEDADKDKINTTLRLEPVVRKFVEEQADHYGVSTQQFISMMLKGLMSGGSHEVVHQTSLMESRIYDIFARNKLSPVKVSEILSSFGITTPMLKDPQRLLSLMTPEVISFLSKKFGVTKNWLSGMSDDIFEVVSFDGQPLQFIMHILDKADDVRNVNIHFVIEEGYTPIESGGECGWAECQSHAGFIVELVNTTEGITRYIIAHQQPWGYVRTRVEMKEILYFLERSKDFNFPIAGYKGWLLKNQEFDGLFSGKAWPSEILQCPSDWAKTGIYTEMHLEDMVDQDGYALEKFEAQTIANKYSKTKLPLIHDFYRENFSCEAEAIRQHLLHS